MMTPVTIKGQAFLALATPRIQSREDVKALRNALLDVVDTCVGDEDAKEATCSRSLHILLGLIVELNKDLED